MITDPKYYSNNLKLFRRNLTGAFEKNLVDIACFRDKKSKNYEDLAKVFVEVCNEFNIRTTLLNKYISLAKQLNVTGVHLTSKQFDCIKDAKKKGLYTIISCHNYMDIEKAQKLYADCAVYSPIFQVKGKGQAKGVDDLKKVIKLFSNMNIIALGGIINDEQLAKIHSVKPYAFASIRYFI